MKADFPEEKNFNLNGPDGFAYYRRGCRNELRRFSTRRNGGGSLMVWRDIFFYGVSPLVRFKGEKDSRKYYGTLELCVLSWAGKTFWEIMGWVLQ